MRPQPSRHGTPAPGRAVPRPPPGARSRALPASQEPEVTSRCPDEALLAHVLSDNTSAPWCCGEGGTAPSASSAHRLEQTLLSRADRPLRHRAVPAATRGRRRRLTEQSRAALRVPARFVRGCGQQNPGSPPLLPGPPPGAA
ncbi:unnamed protein product [Coccothraustes coccothraustes]